jgi:signal transduction histidine kinase
LFLHPYDEQRMLISARGETLRLYDGAQALPFPTAVDEYLKKSDVYTSIPLPDGGFCLTTFKGGVVILERDGRLRRIIDQEAGLPTSPVYAAYSDREGALWLGLGVGIARIDIHSPISLFARVGIRGVVRHGSALYATSITTGTALYHLETNPLTGLPTLQPLASSAMQAFALLPFHDPAGKAPPQLLAATTPLGVMKIEGRAVTPALPREEGPAQGAFSLLQSRTTPKRVFAGRSASVSSLRWEPATRRFVTDNRFLLPVNDPEAEASLRLLPNGDIWSQNGGFAERRQGLFRRQPDGTYQLDEEPFRGLSRFGFRNIMAEPDGNLWIAGLDGLIRFDPRIKPAAPPPFAVLVRRVSAGQDAVVFGGFTPDGAAPLRLPYANNSLRFAFAAPTYGDEAGVTYRYTLEGADRDWSGWDKQTEANYSSLGPGAYRLRVQARTSAGRVGEEGVYSFTILPPWYRSWWAYGVYALLLAGLMYAASRLLRRRIVAREQAKAAQREAELRAETALREAELRADAAAAQAKSLQAENEAYQRLKATQEQLLVQEKLASLGALTAGIAHEIKNPLNFVNNFADLSVELMDELREDIEKHKAAIPAQDYENIEALLDDLSGNAKKINEHGKRADGIVRSMLLHSRGQTGERQPTDINKMLDEYVNLTYHGWRKAA